MLKIAVWASNGHPAYVQMLQLAVHRFQRLHAGWHYWLYDVGLMPDQRDWFMARDFDCYRGHRPSPTFSGKRRYIPTAEARCYMLAEIPLPMTVMVYMDSDGLVLSSLDSLVDQFVASGRPFGIAAETDPRFALGPMRLAWTGGRAQPDYLFAGQDRWLAHPMLNTGLVLATGHRARRFGKRCVEALPHCAPYLELGEQGLIGGLLLESGLEWFPLTRYDHCCVYEEHLTHTGVPYVDPVLLDGQPILFRHFPTQRSKQVYAQRLPELLEAEGLPAQRPRS